VIEDEHIIRLTYVVSGFSEYWQRVLHCGLYLIKELLVCSWRAFFDKNSPFYHFRHLLQLRVGINTPILAFCPTVKTEPDCHIAGMKLWQSKNKVTGLEEPLLAAENGSSSVDGQKASPPPPPVSFLKLFKHADALDWALIIAGSLG
jgi:hypothetical protein